MAFPIAAVLGLAGSYFGAQAQKKAAEKQAAAIQAAANKQAATLRGLAAPYKGLLDYSLPATKSLVDTQIMPTVGKEDPLLTAEHGMNLTGIGRGTNRALAKSKSYWTGTGNVGKLRGEQLAIGQSGVEATNRENLGYGTSQANYKRTRLGLAMDALNGLTQTGNVGTNMLANAAGVEAGGATSAAGVNLEAGNQMYSDIGTIAGIPIGVWLDAQAKKQKAQTATNTTTTSATSYPKNFQSVRLASKFR